jgi:hypothetical protein
MQAALRFDAPPTLRSAAGELGVPDVLAGRLLRGSRHCRATLGRDAFAAVYVVSVCVLSEPLAIDSTRPRVNTPSGP